MKGRAEVFVFTAVFFVSLSAILIRLSHAEPILIAFYRMAFSTLLMLPLLGAPGTRGNTRRKDIFRGLSGRDWILCTLSGVFLALHFWSWVTSLFHTTVAEATVLVNIHPVLVMAGGILILKETITRRALLYMLIAFGGSILLALSGAGNPSGGQESHLLGNSLAVTGAAAVSGYMLIGRLLRSRISTYTYTVIVYSVSAACLLGLAVLSGSFPADLPAREYLIFLLLAVFPTLLGHSVFNWSLRYLRASYVSTAVLGEPVFAGIIAVFLFDEIPGPFALAGAAIVLIAISLFNRESKKLR
ncbi:MAG: DMT family transporter [Spirochaetales bacterium]|nr:DMT family transporter [Spirochaetales bacterium]MCF7938553.1 DMT family transporter [Spirochaetales bacterium]